MVECRFGEFYNIIRRPGGGDEVIDVTLPVPVNLIIEVLQNNIPF